MKKSGFKQKTIAEVKEKQALKRLKAEKKPRKATKLGNPAKNAGKVANRAKSSSGKTQAQLKKELDKIFSLYIRKIYPAKCYTCGKTDTALQCGHFVLRQYLATRWHENNCRPQCAGCNIFGNGKPLDFEENLKKELGNEYVEKMKLLRHESLKLDRQWYQEKIEHYKALI